MKSTLNPLVILITGCSSGFGLLTAARLASRGHRVIASMRNLNKSGAILDEVKIRGGKVDLIQLDVTDKNSVKSELVNADLLVNATSLGLKPNDSTIVSKSDFPKKKMLVYDLIYHVKKTPLLRLASRLGHRIKNGETMLLAQGAKAFEIWTGKKAPVTVMRKALQNAV